MQCALATNPQATPNDRRTIMPYDQVDLNEILLEGADYVEGSELEAGSGSDEEAFGDLEAPDDSLGEFGYESAEEPVPLQEQEAMAYELMGLSSEPEMDEFLGKLLRRVGKGLKQIGGRILPQALPFLKGPARQLLAKALPFIGTAAGSIVPGLGNVLGGAAGAALGKMISSEGGDIGPEPLGELVIEGEYGTLEEARVDVARRLVRTLSQATAAAATDPRAAANPAAVARDALSQAVQQHLPPRVRRVLAARRGGGASGRWMRRGNRIILLGV